MYMKTREKKERDLKRRKVYILFEDRDLSPSLKLCLAFDEIIYNSLFPLSLKIFCVPFSRFSTKKTTAFEFLIGSSHISRAQQRRKRWRILEKERKRTRWIR